MFAIARTLTLLLLALAALPVLLGAAETKTPPAEKLIEQLGSNDFAQREHAARMLQKRGPVVLPALRKARNHADAEVRRRVRAMIPILERDAALAPKRISLDSEPRTLSAVLKEIEKQTGYKVKTENSDNKTCHCFAMKGVTFWEAMERIGRATNRVVSIAALEEELFLNPNKTRSPFVALNGPFRLEVLQLNENRNIDFTKPNKGKEKGFRDYGLTLTFSVLVEPQFILLAAARGRIRIATDEDGKSLKLPVTDDPPIYIYSSSELRWRDFDSSSVLYLQRSSGKERAIKVLRGVVPVKVVVERKRVVFTDNILKAKGTKCRLRQGNLEIEESKREKDGDLLISILVPMDGANGSLFRWLHRVHLEDDKGNPYDAFGRGKVINGHTKSINLLYHPSKDPKVGLPSKLIVEDWTIMNYDIPFEFKDIPLP